MIRVGILGLGFIGRTHAAGYVAAKAAGLPVEIVAVCDANPALRAKLVQPGEASGLGPVLSGARWHTEPGQLLADPGIDLVSVCTYTESHAELAIVALRAGKHVLVEKPVALCEQDVRPVLDAARDSSRVCMPAMCMRFWPGWTWLKQRIDDGTLGRVRSAAFQRLAAPPSWGVEFFRDETRSGGALVDLHIHDADFVRWCFGEPTRVSTVGTLAHLTTQYRFAAGPAHVVAEGAWDHGPGFPFRSRFCVAFERATVEYDSNREAPLMCYQDGAATVIETEIRSGWELEIRELVDCLARGERPTRSTIEDAAATARLLDAERASLERGTPVEL
ncbi:MAG: Gfo/Idh/MocA family oxidoreductase [Phycisphaerae bacterium]